MTAVHAPDGSAVRLANIDMLRQMWTLMPVLAVLNVLFSIVFFASGLAAAAPWLQAVSFPVTLLWLLVTLDDLLQLDSQSGSSPVAVVSALRAAALPTLRLGMPVAAVVLSVSTAETVRVRNHADLMLLPLFVGCFALALFAASSCYVVMRRPDPQTRPTLSTTWLSGAREAIESPGHAVAAMVILVLVPALSAFVNPGVMLAVPAPFACVALFTIGRVHCMEPLLSEGTPPVSEARRPY